MAQNIVVEDDATAARYFDGEDKNVGVVMGMTSGGLSDTDLDCAEAITIAPYLLRRTGAIFGRASARNSHWLYTTKLAATDERATIAFDDPTKGPHEKDKRLL